MLEILSLLTGKIILRYQHHPRLLLSSAWRLSTIKAKKELGEKIPKRNSTQREGEKKRGKTKARNGRSSSQSSLVFSLFSNYREPETGYISMEAVHGNVSYLPPLIC